MLSLAASICRPFRSLLTRLDGSSRPARRSSFPTDRDPASQPGRAEPLVSQAASGPDDDRHLRPLAEDTVGEWLPVHRFSGRARPSYGSMLVFGHRY